MTPQVLSQDLSISHDFLDQDSQVFHALAKKSSTRVSKRSIKCARGENRKFYRICF